MIESYSILIYYIYNLIVIDTSLGASRTLHRLSFVPRESHSIGLGI